MTEQFMKLGQSYEFDRLGFSHVGAYLIAGHIETEGGNLCRCEFNDTSELVVEDEDKTNPPMVYPIVDLVRWEQRAIEEKEDSDSSWLEAVIETEY